MKLDINGFSLIGVFILAASFFASCYVRSGEDVFKGTSGLVLK